MRKIILTLCLLLCSACTSVNWGEITDAILESGEGSETTGLQNSEVIAGLKEALKIGSQSASDKSSQRDGFFKNPRLFIPLPSEVKKVESTLNGLGLNHLVRDFVESMNRGAEKAAGLAKPILVRAITSMTIEDAWNILKGTDRRAATHYLERAAGVELTLAFRPVVKSSLDSVNATRYWKEIASAYNSVPLVKPIRSDLDQYVTEKCLSGLFLLIADEEEKIRLNPMGYASEIIRKVFGHRS